MAAANTNTYNIQCMAKNKITGNLKLLKTEVFTIPDRYTVTNTRALGWGAYGIVCEATDADGKKVAIKKVKGFLNNYIDSTRLVRECKLLRILNNHPNIIGLLDLFIEGDAETFDAVFMVFEYMETDMKSIIRSSQELTEEHFSFWMYQLCKALKYLESAGVLHRDIKPENILLDADSTLKLADLGLSRTDKTTVEENYVLTEYVVTRYYRAPEVICDRTQYTPAMDMWSAGCIMAEMILRRVFLQGNDQVQQLALILMNTGTPTPEQIGEVLNDNARKYIERSPHHDRPNFAEIFPDASEEAIDLLDKILTWSADDRITATEALEHPWFEAWREAETETVCEVPVDDLTFEFEGKTKGMKPDDFRALVLEECTYWASKNASA